MAGVNCLAGYMFDLHQELNLGIFPCVKHKKIIRFVAAPHKKTNWKKNVPRDLMTQSRKRRSKPWNCQFSEGIRAGVTTRAGKKLFAGAKTEARALIMLELELETGKNNLLKLDSVFGSCPSVLSFPSSNLDFNPQSSTPPPLQRKTEAIANLSCCSWSKFQEFQPKLETVQSGLGFGAGFWPQWALVAQLVYRIQRKFRPWFWEAFILKNICNSRRERNS